MTRDLLRIGRRAFVLGGLGLLVGGRRSWRCSASFIAPPASVTTARNTKGAIVQGITPNEQFYCVTKNVIDPRVDVHLWRLEVNGLVRNGRPRFDRLQGDSSGRQETTLMCISNGLDAGLMSNAVWKGVAMRDLLETASPLSGAAKVRLHGVDNYTDTIPLEKAMDPATLIAFEMNGARLPDRHGYPARVVVPGYFGEKNVKWLTRIELRGAGCERLLRNPRLGPGLHHSDTFADRSCLKRWE